jgi:glycosyltransferase involved in cell wall biosynthesis
MEKSRTKVTLLITTLNEIEGLRQIAPRINPSWCEQILVIDGNSTDGTADYAKSLGYEVVQQKKKGLRSACLEALSFVKTDSVLFFSPDGNSIPELIPQAAQKLREGNDLVIVSRYKEGARSLDENFISHFGNRAITKLINFLFLADYTDVMVIYRGFRKGVIGELGLDRRNPFLEWAERSLNTIVGLELLLSIRCASAGFKVAEIPGDEPVRIGGVTKMKHLRSALIYGVVIIYEYFRYLAKSMNRHRENIK